MPYCITLRSKTMEGSPAGMSAATAGRPITSGKSFSTRNAMPDQYAMSCAASARTIAQSSTLKQSRTTLLSTWRRPCLRAKDLAHPIRSGGGEDSWTRDSARRYRRSYSAIRRPDHPACIGGVR